MWAVTSAINGALLKKMSLPAHILDQEFDKYLNKKKTKQKQKNNNNKKSPLYYHGLCLGLKTLVIIESIALFDFFLFFIF